LGLDPNGQQHYEGGKGNEYQQLFHQGTTLVAALELRVLAQPGALNYLLLVNSRKAL
jgi:hypothetical protein